jgi:hypothetical protein
MTFHCMFLRSKKFFNKDRFCFEQILLYKPELDKTAVTRVNSHIITLSIQLTLSEVCAICYRSSCKTFLLVKTSLVFYLLSI